MPAAVIGNAAAIDEEAPSPVAALLLPPMDGLAVPLMWSAVVAPSFAGRGEVDRVLATTMMRSVAELFDGWCLHVGDPATDAVSSILTSPLLHSAFAMRRRAGANNSFERCQRIYVRPSL